MFLQAVQTFFQCAGDLAGGKNSCHAGNDFFQSSPVQAFSQSRVRLHDNLPFKKADQQQNSRAATRAK